MGRGRRWVGAVVLGLSLAPSVPAAAAGVDGAGRIVVVPLVVTGDRRESLVTLTNTGGEVVRVKGLYVGADGTPRAASAVGEIACDPREIPRDGSVTLRLRDLCPGAFTPDLENMGYLELASDADAHGNFFATSAVDTGRSTTFGVAGHPVGAFDTGLAGTTSMLQVAGLRTQAATDENLFCYAASLAEAKAFTVTLQDGKGVPLGGPLTFALDPRRMVRFDLPADLGLGRTDRDELSAVFDSGDGAQVVAGCGPVRLSTDVLAYQPAQALQPADRARLRSVNVFAGQQVGPLKLALLWAHTLAHDAVDRKVVLSTYLRSDDQVRCRLIPWTGPTGLTLDTTPWTELRMIDPLGVVIAGGNGAKDTGVVSTLPRGRFAPGTTQRYQIEISFDEDAHAANPWPHPAAHGVWGLRCDSGSGMSEPVFLFTSLVDTF
jgi:hypothetical protein